MFLGVTKPLQSCERVFTREWREMIHGQDKKLSKNVDLWKLLIRKNDICIVLYCVYKKDYIIYFFFCILSLIVPYVLERLTLTL